MSNNPIKKEYTNEGENADHIFSYKETEFLLGLDRTIVGFTGNYKEINDEYALETYIYLMPNFYEKTNLEYDSKIFLHKNPCELKRLLLILSKEFWFKGWIHGDLDNSNIVIQYENDNVYFRIFDFEHLEYKNPQNTVDFFKFIWSDIRKFMKEYLILELVRNTKTKKCYWFYDNKYFFKTQENLESKLCNIIDMDSSEYLDFGKNLQSIIKFIDNFAVNKYLYDFKTDSGEDVIGDVDVVGDEMFLL